MSKVTIVNVSIRSTNYWVVGAGQSRLLFDLGWPGMMGAMRANLKRMGVPLDEIAYGLASHWHIDHAGLAQEFKLAGMTLIVPDVQLSAIPLMKTWIKPADRYLDVSMDGNVVVSCSESRALLAQIGVPGEIVHTPGHSDHCVSLLLDDGSAFTGDLTHPDYTWEEHAATARASWRLLWEKGARRVYPAHGPIRPLESRSLT
jgi:glyoxylase-like metal-dependent hydrolase (beta-lactamase superfamily II)